MVTSSNKNLAKEIKAKFKSREVRKTYHAVIFSKDKILAGKWRNFLIKKKAGGKVKSPRRSREDCRIIVFGC